MELIIDSSNIEQIKELNELLTITGVTTNPTILTKSNREAMDVVKDLCEVLSEDQLLFIQTVQTSFEGIMEEAKMISSIRNKNMYVKIPVTHEGLRAIKECKKLGIPIVSILDTNCDPDLVDIPIPGNDDAVKSIKLILNALTDSIINGQAKAS